MFLLILNFPGELSEQGNLHSKEIWLRNAAAWSRVLQHLQDYGLICLPFFYYLNSLPGKIFPLLVLRPKNAANCLIHTLIKLTLSANVKDSRKLSVFFQFWISEKIGSVKKIPVLGGGVCVLEGSLSVLYLSVIFNNIKLTYKHMS